MDKCEYCGVKEGYLHLPSCPESQNPFLSAAPDNAWDDLPTEGRKDDSGKARHDLIPPELPEAVALVLAFGAAKYGERNWEKGMKWGRPFAAMMRHMWAWWRGEREDTETGFSHLWHAAACIAFLIAFEERQIGADDRP
jgi:Domain of unknown function (DUF5664)